MHIPVTRSHVFTTPDKSLVTTTLSSWNRWADTIDIEVAAGLVVVESARKLSVGQNFTDPSLEPEMREEEKARKVMRLELVLKRSKNKNKGVTSRV